MTQETAKKKPRGRPRLADHEKVLALLWGGFSQEQAAEYFGITQQAVCLIAAKARAEDHPLAPPLGGVRPPVNQEAIDKALAGAPYAAVPRDTLDYGHDPGALDYPEPEWPAWALEIARGRGFGA